MNLGALKFRPEVHSVAQAAFGYFVAALVLAGICGTIYKLVAPEGWIVQALGRSISTGAITLAALVMIAGLSWFSGSSPHLRSRISDFFVYGFAAAGIYYLARLSTVGSL